MATAGLRKAGARVGRSREGESGEVVEACRGATGAEVVEVQGG